MSTTKRKVVRINTMRSTFNKNNPTLPGNIRVNEGTSTECWLGAVQFRNILIGYKLSALLDSPLTIFAGCTLSYDELDVTQTDLDAGAGEHKITAQGREISFKTVGLKGINFAMDLTGMNVTESDVNIAKIVQLYGGNQRRTQAPAPVTDGTVAAPQGETAMPNPAVTKIEAGDIWVDNGNGTETNSTSGEMRDIVKVESVAAHVDLNEA